MDGRMNVMDGNVTSIKKIINNMNGKMNKIHHLISELHVTKLESERNLKQKITKSFENEKFGRILKEWKLSQYITNFEQNGYDDIEDWKNLELEDLTKIIKMKHGHAKKFLRLVGAY